MVFERWSKYEAFEFMAELSMIFYIVQVPFGPILTIVNCLILKHFHNGLFFIFYFILFTIMGYVVKSSSTRRPSPFRIQIISIRMLRRMVFLPTNTAFRQLKLTSFNLLQLFQTFP